jgi:ubiquinone/menaquinone biosynthesis C-methylase UbiE
MDQPFSSSARVYDLLYEAAGKDYEVEADELHALIQSRRPGAASLLDVACGTGAHLVYLRRHYEVAGLDRAPAMLAEARDRLPGVPLIAGDMRSTARSTRSRACSARSVTCARPTSSARRCRR